ncbi:MAG: hypothetical protein KTR31_09655 [Myxococcales bacterium]|nr:hypothetical protein [Myxococcales bacterium]
MTTATVLLAFLGCGTPETPAPQPAAAPAPEDEIADAVAAEAVDGATACDVQLYVYESDPQGLMLYQHPERGAAELSALPVDTEVTVTQVKGPWAFVKPSESGTSLPSGWAGIELLTTNLRTPDEYGASAKPMYGAAADADADEAIALPIESLTVKGCDGPALKAEWEDAKGKTVTGWLPAGSHCGQPNTTCE